jgi:hypothetical protein
MFADAEEVEADLIRQRALVDDVPEGLGRREQTAVGGHRHVAERIDAKFNRV